jgi:hypothetical protein
MNKTNPAKNNLSSKKKIFKYSLSRPTKTTMSNQIVGLRECWLSNLSDILGGICQIWEYDRWYTWSVLYNIMDTIGPYI